MAKHVTILAVLHILFGILGLFAAGVVFLTLMGSGLLSGDAGALLVTGGIGTIIAIFLGVMSLPALIGGLGLMQRKPWARILVLVLGFLNLINIPIGTILGGYTIWALMHSETERLFVPGGASEHAAYPV